MLKSKGGCTRGYYDVRIKRADAKRESIMM